MLRRLLLYLSSMRYSEGGVYVGDCFISEHRWERVVPHCKKLEKTWTALRAKLFWISRLSAGSTLRGCESWKILLELPTAKTLRLCSVA